MAYNNSFYYIHRPQPQYWVITYLYINIYTIPYTLVYVGKSVSWVGIWTPAWIVNAVLLYASIHICIDKPKYNDDGELIETEEEDKVTIQVKILTFIQTILIILLQVFIMCKLDGDLGEWKWSGVFAPWFMYEG